MKLQVSFIGFDIDPVRIYGNQSGLHDMQGLHYCTGIVGDNYQDFATINIGICLYSYYTFIRKFFVRYNMGPRIGGYRFHKYW